MLKHKYSLQEKEENNHSHHFLKIQRLTEDSNKYTETSSNHKGNKNFKGKEEGFIHRTQNVENPKNLSISHYR